MSDSSADAIIPVSVTTDDGWKVQSSSRAVGARTADEVKADATTGMKVPQADTDADESGAHEDEAAVVETKAEDGAADGAKAKPDAEKDKKARHLARQAEIQARINARTRELREIERQIEARKAQLTGPTAEKTDTHAGVKAITPTRAELAEMPVWAEYEADGKEFKEYERDKAAWDDKRLTDREAKIKADIAAQIEREQKLHAEQADRAAREKAYFDRIDQVRAAHEDFDDAVATISELPMDQHGMWQFVLQEHAKGPEVLYWLAKNPDEAKNLMDIEWTNGAAQGLMAADDPVAVTAYLAHHPDERDEILAMPRPRAIRALALIESKLAAESAKSDPASLSTAPVTRAKAPLKAVAGTRTSGDSRDEYDLPFAEFVKRRNAARQAGRPV
ncbi:MAG: hypothetical protein IT183_06840 [Acidobacteria bacterium]|nr:hypothetical protein [Acidobacteriota bacterium]